MMGDLQVVGRVKKLDKKNYNTWATLMESCLQGKDLQEIVCGNNMRPPIEDAALKK